MYSKATVTIDSRVHLLSTLAGTTAGISFALNRYFTPSELTSEKLS
jgi:hypothetical protein